MNLAKIAIDNKATSYFAVVVLVAAGIAGFFSLGQLEDPEFTIKTAVISTPYPGAGPQEVELEVTDRIELAIQEMLQIKYIESLSRAGLSIIKVDIKPIYTSADIPQIWDELRRKIRDLEANLPPGAGRPIIGDDFGDVFGFQLALTGDGFSYSELERYAKELKKEISLVAGVARVDLWGVQSKVIYLDVSQTQLTQLGLSEASIASTLSTQNSVVDAGSLNLQDRRFRIAPSGEFRTPADIANLVVRPSPIDALQAGTFKDAARPTELIRIRDFGTIRRGYAEPPANLMRFNGAPAIGISITNVSGVNIVDVGRGIDLRLTDMIAGLPIGIEVHKVHWQSDIVAEAVRTFMINFAEAVAIVLVVLTIVMGWRMGMIIGAALIATILGSFLFMAIFDIDLQRMSLGALVIALGMMVDNAIVVADGFVVRLQRGVDRVQAAIESARQPALPLLGATVVAVMAFYPIFASTENAGEYCATLFSVVAISLLVSWVISMTLTPLMCMDILPAPKNADGDRDPYGSRLFRGFRTVLTASIRVRWLTIAVAIGFLAVSIVGFGNVKQLFFPDSSMTKFMIDYWAPQGTRIEQVAADLKLAEAHLQTDERVVSVVSFMGSGPPRFYLPVEPEKPYSSYAQLIVNVTDFREVPDMIVELNQWFRQNMPQAAAAQRPFGVGPSNTWKFDVRVVGPSGADGRTLRIIAGEISAVLTRSPLAGYVRTDWRQRVQKVVPRYSQERGRWAAVSRADFANATKRAFDGRAIGLYREADDLIPIIMRHVEEERRNVGGFDVIHVQSDLSTGGVPLSQVTEGIDAEWEDPLIWRRDRRRTIKVQTNPIPGVTLPTLRASVVQEIEAIKLPPGYQLEWGGEFESSRDSQASLAPGVIPALAIIVLIIVALFNAYRPPLVIFLTIPFALIGVTAGLLVFDTPFGFLALLGAMSLTGMMIKNAIVLLDEINILLADGRNRYDAVVEAGLSRLRPVTLAAATTVLGVAPLLQDVFWVGLAVTVMAGLTFGTVLTMILVPVLYATMYRVTAAKA